MSGETSPEQHVHRGHDSGAPLQASGRQGDAPSAVANLRKEIVGGLLYVHSRLNANTSEALEALTFVSALIDLLTRKGLIASDELEDSRHAAGRRLAENFDDKGLGVMLETSEEDKYAYKGTVEIDCASRVHLCRASCCRLAFSLSKQDVQEGVVRWNLMQPYLNAREKDGYCCHLERGTMGCNVHDNRPIACRAFDCRQDKRIWLDFEKGVVNPAVARDDWPHCLKPVQEPVP